MQIRQFMEQYGRKTEEIEALQAKIAELRAHAEKCTSVLSLAPGGNAYNDSRMEALVVKINDLEQQLGILWEERGGVYIDIVSLLSEISDERCRRVLEMRYLELELFEDIANDLAISFTTVYRIHRTGLEAAQKVLKKRDKSFFEKTEK